MLQRLVFVNPVRQLALDRDVTYTTTLLLQLQLLFSLEVLLEFTTIDTIGITLELNLENYSVLMPIVDSAFSADSVVAEQEGGDG